jgi:hypothetical protein
MMHKRALVTALILLCGLASFVSLAVPGSAQHERALSLEDAPRLPAGHEIQQDVGSAASLESTVIFQQGVSPTASYEGVADTYIFNEKPAENHGQDAVLSLYYDGRQRALLRFELAEHIPTRAVVTSAKLELRTFQKDYADATDVGLYQVLRPWAENEASWDNAAAGEPWQIAGCGAGIDRASQYAALTTLRYENTLYSWEGPQFTALVQEWIADPSSNHGVILIGLSPDDRQIWRLHSSQHGTNPDQKTRRPQLTVSFNVPPPTVTPTRTATPLPTPTGTRTPTRTPSPTEGPPGGSVAGMAWNDADRDGARDSGELPLRGIPIVLRDYASNEQLGRIVTAADGSYQFTTLLAGSYLLTNEVPSGWACSFPPGGAWVFPLIEEHLRGKDFGLYLVPTSTPTNTPGPSATITPTPSPTATGVATRTPSPTLPPGTTPSVTPSPSPTATSTQIPTLTPTATSGPSPTPTATPVGTFEDPLPANCHTTYSGNTNGYPAAVLDYGACFSGLSGPEVIYALQVQSRLDYLSVALDPTSASTLFVFVLSGASPGSCLQWGREAVLVNAQPGTYYIAVDGFGAGPYRLGIDCDPPQGETPTPTSSPTGGPGPTPTGTLTPGGPHVVYLPVVQRQYPIEFFANCGGGRFADSEGGHWLADQEYTAGTWGHVNSPLIWSTKREIQGTVDGALYQTQRYGNGGSFLYRFDVPNGRYEVELRFAELFFDAPGERVFDVRIEGQTILDDLDVVDLAGGNFRALVRTFTAEVSDEQLDIALVRDWANGVENPIINAIRVTKID